MHVQHIFICCLWHNPRLRNHSPRIPAVLHRNCPNTCTLVLRRAPECDTVAHGCDPLKKGDVQGASLYIYWSCLGCVRTSKKRIPGHLSTTEREQLHSLDISLRLGFIPAEIVSIRAVLAQLRHVANRFGHTEYLYPMVLWIQTMQCGLQRTNVVA